MVSSPITAICFPDTPAIASRPDDDHAEHERGPEVGLDQHQPDRHRREAERDGEPPRVELAPVLVEVAGEGDDDPELRELRRLQREATGSWNHACWPLMFEPTGASTATRIASVAKYASIDMSRSLR